MDVNKSFEWLKDDLINSINDPSETLPGFHWEYDEAKNPVSYRASIGQYSVICDLVANGDGKGYMIYCDSAPEHSGVIAYDIPVKDTAHFCRNSEYALMELRCCLRECELANGLDFHAMCSSSPSLQGFEPDKDSRGLGQHREFYNPVHGACSACVFVSSEDGRFSVAVDQKITNGEVENLEWDSYDRFEDAVDRMEDFLNEYTYSVEQWWLIESRYSASADNLLVQRSRFIQWLEEEHGYEGIQLNEGTLGFGDFLFVPPENNGHVFVVREVPKGGWDCGYHVEHFDRVTPELEAECAAYEDYLSFSELDWEFRGFEWFDSNHIDEECFHMPFVNKEGENCDIVISRNVDKPEYEVYAINRETGEVIESVDSKGYSDATQHLSAFVDKYCVAKESFIESLHAPLAPPKKVEGHSQSGYDR